MPRAIGIDLGTTNTAVAVLDGGRPRVIEDERGYKVLPSVVSAKGEGRFIVGQAAHSLIITNPDSTVYATKRLIGRRFDSPEVQKVLSHVQYKLRPAPDGGVQLQIGDQWMTPSEVAAVILQVARGIAERALGEPVEEAVITVPAYFNHAQRKATLEAAEIAGLRCDRLLNEPTAAALAYGHRKNIDRTILIFDLGGGTFDVSVLKLSEGLYEILASSGDTFLGGEDFDYRIVDHLADHFKARARVDPRQDRSALQRLKDAAERAKCELSFSDRTNIVIPQLAAGESLEMVLTRSTLEALTDDLVARCLDIARRAVSDAGLSLADIEEVILVGGQTRMPKVREAVAGVFGREPNRSVHPEEVVAIGAAVHASNLEAGESARTVLLDVTPFDLGIDTAGGMFVPVIARNARVPASESKVFATVADNQETVRITIRQGDNRTAAQNELLGEFVLEGLTPALRLQTKVDVTFRIDTNGILHVAALERGKEERRNITIRNYAEHARAPAFPDADQARADDLARKMRAEQGEAGPKNPKKQKAGARGGLIDLLLGRRKTAAVAAATAAGATATAVAGSEAAGAAAPSAPPGAAPVSAGRPVDSDLRSVSEGAAPMSIAGEVEGTLPEAEVAALLEEWNEEDLTPADGLVLDPYVEPVPVPLEDEGELALAGGSGLSPFEEDVYRDVGAVASLGLAGALAAAQPSDNPFADLGNPIAPPTRTTGRALSLSDLFLEEDGLGDVEVMDPFAPRSGRMDDTFAGDAPQEGAFGARSFDGIDVPLDDTPAVASGPRIAAPALADDFEDLFAAPFDRAASADPLADPFRAAAASPARSPLPQPAFLQGPAEDWESQSGLASDVTIFAAGEDEDEHLLAPVGVDGSPVTEPPPGREPWDAGVDGLVDVALEPLGEDASALAEDPDLFASPALLDPGAAHGWAEDEPTGQRTNPAPGGSAVEQLVSAAEGDPEADAAARTGFALLDPPTDVRASLAAAASGFDVVPVDRTAGGTTSRTATLDWIDASVAADADWSIAEVRSEAHTMPGAESSAPRPLSSRARRPARVRLNYRELETLVTDARENLRRGGAFIRTERPLKVGRECVFELAAPGMDQPLVLPALVTFVATAGPGQEAGMGVEYRLEDAARLQVERLLNRL